MSFVYTGWECGERSSWMTKYPWTTRYGLVIALEINSVVVVFYVLGKRVLKLVCHIMKENDYCLKFHITFTFWVNWNNQCNITLSGAYASPENRSKWIMAGHPDERYLEGIEYQFGTEREYLDQHLELRVGTHADRVAAGDHSLAPNPDRKPRPKRRIISRRRQGRNLAEIRVDHEGVGLCSGREFECIEEQVGFIFKLLLHLHCIRR